MSSGLFKHVTSSPQSDLSLTCLDRLARNVLAPEACLDLQDDYAGV